MVEVRDNRKNRRHETKALLRAHLSAAARYGHATRNCPVCHRLQRLALEDPPEAFGAGAGAYETVTPVIAVRTSPPAPPQPEAQRPEAQRPTAPEPGAVALQEAAVSRGGHLDTSVDASGSDADHHAPH